MKKQFTTTRRTIQLFWRQANNYKRYLYPVLLLVPLTVLISDIAQPYIISRVLQLVSSGNYDKHNLWASFHTYLIWYAALVPVWAIAGWRAIIWIDVKLENNVIRDLAMKVFNQLSSMSADFHANRFAGSLVSQANKLTGAYIRFADASIFSLLTLITTMVASITVLAPRVPLFAAAMLILSVLYIIGIIFYSKPVRDANKREAQAQSSQTGDMADSITNIMAIKSFAASDFERKRYLKSSDRVFDAGMDSLRALTVRETFASTVTTSIAIAALFIAVLGVNRFGTSIATLFLIISYSNSIGQRLWEFQNVLRQYNRAFGDASDMVEIFEIEPGIKDPANPEVVTSIKGKLTFRDVAFTHAGNEDTLFEDLNLDVQVGEKVGLVGQSGSGKTTLTRLILRYSDIDSGAILIDDYNIKNISQDDVRKQISYVPQEPLLFHRSLTENIAYGHPGATQAQVEKAAKLAHAHEFIKQLPQGYETLVGERGVKLSGGQRQRIAIARAMIKNAPILVLDEATSALDSESEKLIQDALWKLMEGKTALVIAHRLSTVQKMDRIIVMRDGKIIEQGTHKELIAQKGNYAELWNHQSGGFLDD